MAKMHPGCESCQSRRAEQGADRQRQEQENEDCEHEGRAILQALGGDMQHTGSHPGPRARAMEGMGRGSNNARRGKDATATH
eukprot:949250-Alexandrium_andersonii.AAC.1